jgi:hypothetical protein
MSGVEKLKTRKNSDKAVSSLGHKEQKRQVA